MAVSPKAEASVCCASCKMSEDPSIWPQASPQTALSPSTFANSSLPCVNRTANSAFGSVIDLTVAGALQCFTVSPGGKPLSQTLREYFTFILNFLSAQKMLWSVHTCALSRSPSWDKLVWLQ